VEGVRGHTDRHMDGTYIMYECVGGDVKLKKKNIVAISEKKLKKSPSSSPKN